MNNPQNENSSGSISPKSETEVLIERYQAFAGDFANKIVVQDWVSAHQFLAPWLQREISPDDLQEKVDKELWETNGYWDINELIYPTDFSVSYNSSSLASLKVEYDWREPRKFSDELTDENFRKWMVIQFLPDENDSRTELDAWFDFWFVVAEINGQLKVGYFEFEDPD